VNEELTREWITERFRADTPNPVKKDWGDHLLNPRMGQADNLIPAAVLIPVVNREDELKVLFTRRAANLAQHAGQISFPGGHLPARVP